MIQTIYIHTINWTRDRMFDIIKNAFIIIIVRINIYNKLKIEN
jgi:hypothetical protein